MNITQFDQVVTLKPTSLRYFPATWGRGHRICPSGRLWRNGSRAAHWASLRGREIEKTYSSGKMFQCWRLLEQITAANHKNHQIDLKNGLDCSKHFTFGFATACGNKSLHGCALVCLPELRAQKHSVCLSQLTLWYKILTSMRWCRFWNVTASTRHEWQVGTCSNDPNAVMPPSKFHTYPRAGI